jgi:signal transduction histidine kinase
MTVSSSSTGSSPEGLAFVCTPEGAVRRVVRATLAEAHVGSSLGESVHERSREACAMFLRGIARGGFARSAPLRIGMRDVHCFGLCRPSAGSDELRVVGVIDPLDAAPFAENVAREDRDTHFLALAEEIRRTHSTYELYEELARANNELVTAQRELARTVAELERMNSWKNEILGMAAHDLRNPLSVNRGLVAFLQKDREQLTPDSRRLLERLGSNSDYMLRLVDSVLDFSAIESGAVRLEPEEAQLGAIVEEVLATMRILADAKAISIAFRDAELPPLKVDRIKLMEALNNLIGNAVQYSPAGSVVEVRVKRQGHEAVIEIQDRGPGIPQQELADLFTPFKRLSTAKLGRRRSVGLGLAITRRLIEAHGGRVQVDTEVGRGSTFVVRLPIR